MTEKRRLETDRLILRPLESSDAGRIQTLAGAEEVAAGTLNIPHPYPLSAAVDFIAFTAHAWEAGEHYTFGVTVKPDDALVGCIGLSVRGEHRRAELGYWIGVPFWGQGYATEAARRAIDFGFDTLELNKILAMHFPENPASGRVLKKAGMSNEGLLRQQFLKNDRFRDVYFYAITRDDYRAADDNSGS